jgi:hypothetical protein
LCHANRRDREETMGMIAKATAAFLAFVFGERLGARVKK